VRDVEVEELCDLPRIQQAVLVHAAPPARRDARLERAK
jgi:hypothetical protein